VCVRFVQRQPAKLLLNVYTEDSNLVKWLVIVVCFGVFNQRAYIHSFENPTKHSVFIIEPRSWDCGDEKLRSICVGPFASKAEDH
jgi:hypothetical protein